MTSKACVAQDVLTNERQATEDQLKLLGVSEEAALPGVSHMYGHATGYEPSVARLLEYLS